MPGPTQNTKPSEGRGGGVVVRNEGCLTKVREYWGQPRRSEFVPKGEGGGVNPDETKGGKHGFYGAV